MLDSAARDERVKVIGLVEGILRRNRIDRPVSPDSALTEIGLTSIDMVSLMLEVESEFDIEIPPTSITPENFYSVDSIHRLAMQLRA